MRRLTLLLCLVVFLSGCARMGIGAGASASAAKPDDPIGGGGGSVPPITDGSRREQPDPSVVSWHGAAVDHYAIGADGRTVVIYWWGGNPSCFGLKRVDVEIVDGRPLVTILEGTRADAVGEACTMEALLKSTVVVLDEQILVDSANPDAEPGEPPFLGAAERARPEDGLVDAVPHAVTGYRLEGDGTTLEVYYVGGLAECYGLDSATASSDGGAQITVTVSEGRRPDAGACDEIGVAKMVRLDLSTPLITSAAFGSEEERSAS